MFLGSWPFQISPRSFRASQGRFTHPRNLWMTLKHRLNYSQDIFSALDHLELLNSFPAPPMSFWTSILSVPNGHFGHTLKLFWPISFRALDPFQPLPFMLPYVEGSSHTSQKRLRISPPFFRPSNSFLVSQGLASHENICFPLLRPFQPSESLFPQSATFCQESGLKPLWHFTQSVSSVKSNADNAPGEV